MQGIARIKIQSTWHDWQTVLAERHAHVADAVYRKVFTLADGEEDIKISKDDAMARYDWKEGIDVILSTKNGTRMTLQEKFLTYWESTATFEEKKTSGEPGAWYYCTAQYYFVGYTRKYWDWKKRMVYDNPIIDFQDWIIIDLPALHREDERGELIWEYKQNGKDGRKSTFRIINFNAIPASCIILKSQ